MEGQRVEPVTFAIAGLHDRYAPLEKESRLAATTETSFLLLQSTAATDNSPDFKNSAKDPARSVEELYDKCHIVMVSSYSPEARAQLCAHHATHCTPVA